MKKFKLYKVIIIAVICSLLSANDYYFFYSLNQGANLLSFSTIEDNISINNIFDDDNPNLIANSDMQSNILSIITEGQIGININNQWQGSLNQVSTEKGYWLILNEPMSFLYTGSSLNENTYFLHPGSNLISFPFANEMHINDALPIYTQDILEAIIGENESLLINNGQFFGSLMYFKPGNGYWFIAKDHSIFSYESSRNENTQNSYKNIKDQNRNFNQSVIQSIYFTESIYLNGEKNNDEMQLNIYCNDKLVGNKNWIGEYSDLIAMGNDGYEWTEGYCDTGQNVKIKTNEDKELFIIQGNSQWIANNFNIITLSNANFGDLNYDNLINVADIIIMIDYIVNTNIPNNNHQLLLADINKDEIINIADIIINIETIINN